MTYNGQIYNEEGRRPKAPLVRSLSFYRVSPAPSLDVRRLAVRHQHVLVAALNGERVILSLKPYKLGFEVAYSLLEAAHLGNHAGIGTADVAE
jgi:hypothetical protein